MFPLTYSSVCYKVRTKIASFSSHSLLKWSRCFQHDFAGKSKLRKKNRLQAPTLPMWPQAHRVAGARWYWFQDDDPWCNGSMRWCTRSIECGPAYRNLDSRSSSRLTERPCPERKPGQDSLFSYRFWSVAPTELGRSHLNISSEMKANVAAYSKSPDQDEVR